MAPPARHAGWLALAWLGMGCPQDDAPPSPPVDPPGACDDAPGWEVAQGYVRTWCTPCHSASVTDEARQGAPAGVDFDTWSQVAAWSDRIEARATGPSPDMPPVIGATADEIDRFAQWLACGAEGTDPAPGPCDALVVASARTVSTQSDADALCAEANAVEALTVTAEVDLDCLCEVQGDLTTTAASFPQLLAVSGDLKATAGEARWPTLGDVGGHMLLDGASALVAPALQHVGGELQGGPLLTEVALPGLLTLGGALTLTDAPLLERIQLQRVRTIDGAVTLRDLPALATLEGFEAVERIDGGIELAALGQLASLDTFRLLTELGGPVVVRDNPVLMEIDGFTTLPSLPATIEVTGNPRLESLEGFDLLDDVGDLTVHDNGALGNVFGFVNLTHAGVVSVEGSPALRSLRGLSALQQTAGLRLIDLDVVDLPWFSQLQVVTGHVVLSNQRDLVRITGLGGLTRIDGDLRLRLNPLLTTLEGPGTLPSVGGTLALDALPVFTSAPMLSNLGAVGSTLRVVGTGLQDVDDLDQLTTVGGDLVITDNPDLPQIQVDALINAVQVDGITEARDNGP